MKADKVVEAARAMALENLVPPEITVVTRDKYGHIQLWWCVDTSQNADAMARLVYGRLNLSVAGHWLVGNQPVTCKSLGHDTNISSAYCRRFSVLERRLGTDMANIEEKEFKHSNFVSGILKQIFEGTYRKPGVKAVPDPYAIVTKFEVDTITFDTMEAAQNHVKGAKIFDEFHKVDPEADYFTYQTVIEAMIADPAKYIALLQGK